MTKPRKQYWSDAAWDRFITFMVLCFIAQTVGGWLLIVVWLLKWFTYV